MVVGAALGEMLIPLTIGLSFDAISPTSITWLTLIICVFATLLFVLLHYVGTRGLLMPCFRRSTCCAKAAASKVDLPELQTSVNSLEGVEMVPLHDEEDQ